ncbi:MAG: TonB family C-terminal domain protein [Acidobacteria bacterium]|nr:TonB family C-terminal domain protein [Acidobacteriota bacterium]
MPLNVRRFFASAAFVSMGVCSAYSQTAAPAGSAPTAAQTAPTVAKIAAPSSAEIMRERISKAKAFIAVKNYNAAIYELENIRRETSDQTVHGVINVLLMNSYLEQSDYTRAQAFLKELSNPQKSAKPVPSTHYFAVAGQVVKGARNQLERYRSLGLTVSDRNLPLEAAVDVEKMRETLELVVEQTKVIGKEKDKTAHALALLEEATTTRSSLAKDDYDARRWKDEISDAREQLTSSRSVITNAVNDTPTETPVPASSVASNDPVANTQTAELKQTETSAAFKPVSSENGVVAKPFNANAKPDDNLVAKNETPSNNPPKSIEAPKEQPRRTEDAPKTNEAPKNNSAKPEAAQNSAQPTANENNTEKTTETQTAKNETPIDNSPLKVGSLVNYATTQAKPVYPPAARNMRMTGVVKVEILVNENGEVTEVHNTTGPSMLQRAATDAVKKWRFKPFVRDGQPVKASGFVNFNFSL